MCRQGRFLMERSLGLTETFVEYDDDTVKMVSESLEEMIRLVRQNENRWYWYTNWEIILKSENRIIGGLAFYSQPDDTGTVEIGYVIQEAYRSAGYAFEALSGIISWAFGMENVNFVRAETLKTNDVSMALLEKLGFEIFRQTGDTLLWQKAKPH